MSAGYAGARYCFSRRNRRFSFAWSLGSGGAWDGLSCRTRGRLSLAVSVRSLWTRVVGVGRSGASRSSSPARPTSVNGGSVPSRLVPS